MRTVMKTALAAALLAMGSVAGAQPSSPTMYCVPGTPFACFGMEFTMSGTTGTFWLQNLQGSVSDDPTPYSIGDVGVLRVNPSVEDVPLEQMAWSLAADGGRTVGDVALEPGGGERMEEDSYIETELDVFQSRLYFASSPSSGLFGCALPPGDWAPGEYIGQTCPALGVDGWWQLVFGAYIRDPVTGEQLRELVPEDVTFAVGGCVIRGANSGIGVGERGADCIAAPYPYATTVPEPGTLALVGGGVAVLALVGRRRRRGGR